MSRRSTVVSTVMVAAVVVVVAACEGGDTADDTIPAIVTTTSATPAVRSANERFHEVQAGDTLTAIAARYGLSIEAIMQMNAITNPDELSVGQILELPLPPIPTAAPVPTSAPVPTAAP